MHINTRNWLLFAGLSIIWGSTLFWQKMALREIGPFQVVAMRFLIAFVLMFILMRWRRLSFPRDAKTWFEFFILSLVYSVLPVFLAAWAGTRIDTGLGSILGATTPLFLIVLSSFVFRDEPATAAKTLGTLVGFVGMIVIVGVEFVGAARVSDPLGELAQIGSSFGNALAAVLAGRMLRRTDPILQTAMLVLIADVVMWALTPAFEQIRLPLDPLAWAGLLWLGLLASGAANLMFFTLLKAWGPTRAGMVSYSIPLVGLAFGVILLREPLTPGLLLGSVLVLGGIAITNSIWQRAARRKPQNADPAPSTGLDSRV